MIKKHISTHIGRPRRHRIFTVTAAALFFSFVCASPAFAVIRHDVTASTFQGVTPQQMQGYLLGTVFFVARIIGVVTFMWGVYSLITARKDGNAEQITPAMIKLVFGAMMFSLPSILKVLKIIA